MARAVRVQYEGAWYQVMARGNRKEAIFLDDEDREAFLTTLGQKLEAIPKPSFREGIDMLRVADVAT